MRTLPAPIRVTRRALGAFLLTAAFAASCTSGPGSQPPRVSSEAFVAHVQEAEALALQGEAQPSPELMDRVRAALALPAAVALPGRVVIVRQDAYLERLDGNAVGDFRAAVRHLGALRSAATEALVTSPPDAAAIRAALDQAYEVVPRHHPGLFTRAADWVARAIASALRSLVHFSGWETILAWAFLLGLAFLLFRVLSRGGLVPDRTIGRREPQRGRAGGRADWRGVAEEALARGDLEAAVRAMYRAMIAALAARGLVSDDPALTSGECRQAVSSARPALFPAVAEATGAFERVAYGGSPGGMDDVESLRRAERAARAA